MNACLQHATRQRIETYLDDQVGVLDSVGAVFYRRNERVSKKKDQGQLDPFFS
jgi:hypothetical protein